MLCDEEHDLALLKFDDTAREPLKVASSEIIKEGVSVIFAGYPLSLPKEWKVQSYWLKWENKK